MQISLLEPLVRGKIVNHLLDARNDDDHRDYKRANDAKQAGNYLGNDMSLHCIANVRF